MKQHRFFTMYLTTTISVALVLCLVGLECVAVLGAKNLIRNLRENFTLSVVMTDKADSTQISRLGQYLSLMDYVGQSVYVSKEQALEEHIEHLGEDPTQFLGYNPLRPSYEVHLKADYTNVDVLDSLTTELHALPMVEDVIYQQDVVKMLDTNVSEISLILVVVALVLLIMAMALIVNTIRLHIYSKRFLINTMRLVGATPWVIKAPIVKRNLLMGAEAGLLALLILGAVLYYFRMRLGMWIIEPTAINMAILACAVLIGGELITLLASLLATSRYIRMKIDKMYEI